MQRKLIVEEWLALAMDARAKGNIPEAWACENRASEFWTDSEHASYLLRVIAHNVIIRGEDVERFHPVYDVAVRLISDAYMARKTP